VKMIAEYLEKRSSSNGRGNDLKLHFEKQALAYRRLATERANQLGLAGVAPGFQIYSVSGDLILPSSPASQPIARGLLMGSGPSQSKH
jgi:hypothetical protein